MRVTLLALIVIFGTSSLWCQAVPKAEIFAGYSDLNIDTQGLTNRLNANGWEASATFNPNRWLGIEADFSGHYKGNCLASTGITGVNCRHLSFMVGPKFAYRQDRFTGFVHGLVGGDNGTLGLPFVSRSDTSLAFAAGGGLDYAVTKLISIRVAQVDYFQTRHSEALGGINQNNFRFSAGVVFTPGGERHTGRREGEKIPNSSAAGSLGVAGYAAEEGFKLTSVSAGSPAERIFLKAGDVISKIDGKEVHSSGDIESVIAASPTGTVKVSCLIQTAMGMMPSEREIKVR